MAADTARTATMAMAMEAFAAAERPLWEASRSEELPFEELFCGEDVLCPGDACAPRRLL
jgi:hypothetical protein